MPAVLNGVTSRNRAHELFSHYRLWDTEENVGVLLYVNLADHKVEIIVDRAIGRATKSAEWQGVCKTMTKEFANGATSRVLRLPGNETDWVPVHVTVNQVELEAETFAGLLSLRLPTDEEVAAAGLASPTDDSS